MKKFCIFGNPVAHSKSPQMQNAGFKYLNLDASYEKFHLENGDNIKEEFIKNSFSGANITVPLASSPWGDTFGMLTDKLGMEWMVNIAGKKE
jgi:shikimate 5-dehydrogenase